MHIKLTPGQAVFLHGWLAARQTLTWGDILNNPSLCFSVLLTANLPTTMLHQLQPDASSWIKNQKATIQDCAQMAQHWDVHPIRDFKADLADIVSAKWPPHTMQQMNLTYADLVQIGMTPVSMGLFTHVTLAGWAQLGFTKSHAADIHEVHLIRLFGIPKTDVMRSLSNEVLKK
jgi:hypothetical protein